MRWRSSRINFWEAEFLQIKFRTKFIVFLSYHRSSANQKLQLRNTYKASCIKSTFRKVNLQFWCTASMNFYMKCLFWEMQKNLWFYEIALLKQIFSEALSYHLTQLRCSSNSILDDLQCAFYNISRFDGGPFLSSYSVKVFFWQHFR